MSDRLLMISTLLLLLALLTTRISGQAAGEGEEGSGKDDNYDPDIGDTLTDDEDFSRLAAITLHAHSTMGCYTWKETDTESVLRAVKNKMILYIGGVCNCIFDINHVSKMRPRCSHDIDTPLKVDTNITVPYSQNYDDFIEHFHKWIETSPSFELTLTSGVTTEVTIVGLNMYKATPPPTEVTGEEAGSGTPTVVVSTENITVETPSVYFEINSSVAMETNILIIIAVFLLSHIIIN